MTKKLYKGKIAYIEINMPDLISNMSPTIAAEKLNERRITPLNEEMQCDETVGFCNAFSYEPAVDSKSIMGSFLVFGLREDTFKYPKLRVEMEMKEIAKAQGLSPDGVWSKSVKADMAEAVKRQMREKLTPNIKVTDIIFDYSTDKIFILSGSMSVCSRALIHLEAAFDIEIPFHSKPLVLEQNGVNSLGFIKFLYDLAKKNEDIEVSAGGETMRFSISTSSMICLQDNHGNRYDVVSSGDVADNDITNKIYEDDGTILGIQMRVFHNKDDYVFFVDAETLILSKILLPMVMNKDDTTIERLEKLSTLNDIFNYLYIIEYMSKNVEKKESI